MCFHCAALYGTAPFFLTSPSKFCKPYGNKSGSAEGPGRCEKSSGDGAGISSVTGVKRRKLSDSLFIVETHQNMRGKET